MTLSGKIILSNSWKCRKEVINATGKKLQNHSKPQSQEPACKLQIKARTSQIQSRYTYHLIMMIIISERK
jgi:hypothetical protein